MRRYRYPGTAVSLGLAAALAGSARADSARANDIEDLKRSQEELRKLVESQQKEIERLRGEMARGKGAEGAGLAEMIDDLSKKSDNSGPIVWRQVSKQGSKFTLYGFLRLDAHYDTSRMNNPQLPGWVRSEDATAPPGIAAGQNSAEFGMHPKLTRLGFDFDGPVVEALNDAKVTGKLETDFYNATGTNSRAALRMRHAYAKLSWCDGLYTLLAGQTQDLISPLNPVVNNDLVMWGAGNLGDRRPQVRLDWNQPLGESAKLILQGMVGDTGAVDGKDLDPAGTTGAGFLDGQMSGGPTWQGRAALRFKNWDDKDIEVGFWGHAASEDVDTPIGDHGSFESRAVGADVRVPLVDDWLWVQGEIWSGQDLTDVRGGIFQGVNTTTGDEISSAGGFVEVGWKAAPWLTLYGGVSVDDPNDHDLAGGGVTGGRSLNRIWYAASRMNFNPLEVGLEYLHWKTEFIGFDNGVNDRFLAFVSYKF